MDVVEVQDRPATPQLPVKKVKLRSSGSGSGSTVSRGRSAVEGMLGAFVPYLPSLKHAMISICIGVAVFLLALSFSPSSFGGRLSLSSDPPPPIAVQQHGGSLAHHSHEEEADSLANPSCPPRAPLPPCSKCEVCPPPLPPISGVGNLEAAEGGGGDEPLPALLPHRIPSDLSDPALVALVCGLCGAWDASFPLGEVCSAPPPAGFQLQEYLPPPSSFFRLGTGTLLRLRILTMSRLMGAASQRSVFPKRSGRISEPSYSSFELDEAYYPTDHNNFALRYGILLTPAYLTWGAWDAFVPPAMLCPYVGAGAGGGEGKEGDPVAPAPAAGGSSPAHIAGVTMASIEWDWTRLVSGGVSLSPDISFESLDVLSNRSALQANPTLLRWRRELLALRRNRAGPLPQLDEDYSPYTWRGSIVARLLEMDQSRFGGGGGGGISTGATAASAAAASVTDEPTSFSTPLFPFGLLHAAALSVHATSYESTNPILRFPDAERYASFSNDRSAPIKAAITEGNALAALHETYPPNMNAGSTPHMLTAFSVWSNDWGELYGAAASSNPLTLDWGGSFDRVLPRVEAAPGMAASGCVDSQGQDPRGPGDWPAQSKDEIFMGVVRYGDNFFHTFEGLTTIFPVVEWTRLRPTLTVVTHPSEGASGWLDVLRIPFRQRPGAHAGWSDVAAKIAHTTDKGWCMRFRQGVLTMGRDVLRHSLGLAPGGLPAHMRQMQTNAAPPAAAATDPLATNSSSSANASADKNPQDSTSTTTAAAASSSSPSTLTVSVPPSFATGPYILPVYDGQVPYPLHRPSTVQMADDGLGHLPLYEFDNPFAASERDEWNHPPLPSAPWVHRERRTPSILIVRRRTRSIVNHAALVEALQALPVSITAFDAPTWPSLGAAVRAFGVADIVIAPHGAGLSHMVSMRPNATLIEIIPSGSPGSICFMRIAVALQVHYHGFVSDNPPLDAPDQEGVIADVPLILQAIESELGLRKRPV